MITDEQYEQAMNDKMNYENAILDHNMEFIANHCSSAFEDFAKLVYDCEVTEKIEHVDFPSGEPQNESFGIFKNIHVDQWSVGFYGDSFEGCIYAQVNQQWIKIPFSC